MGLRGLSVLGPPGDVARARGLWGSSPRRWGVGGGPPAVIRRRGRGPRPRGAGVFGGGAEQTCSPLTQLGELRDGEVRSGSGQRAV